MAEDAKVKNEKPAEAKQPGTAIVSWQDKMKGLISQTKEAEKPQGGFISFKGGRMTYADEILPGDKIECVIVDYRFSNEYYDKQYDPKNPRSPVCYAITRPGEVQAPHPEAEDPQHEECEGCPRNEWGSDPAGGRGKACKNSRRIHVIAASELERGVDGVNKAQVVTMIPPATSVENFQKCMMQINDVLGTAMFGVVVEVSVKPHDRFLYMVHFKILKQIEDPELLQALMTKYEKTSARDVAYPKNEDRQGSDPRAQSSKY